MTKYDYEQALHDDIMEWLNENGAEYTDEDNTIPTHWGRAYDDIYEALFNDDGITGNGSGSYTFNTWEAEENLCHNDDLLEEAIAELGTPCNDGAEARDVTIRCYLLNRVLIDCIEEYNENHETETTDTDGE